MKNSQLDSPVRSIDFRDKQREFTAYIRDPKNNPPPADIEKQRIDTYRELFFNNIESFLSSNFPVLRTLLDNEQWFELVQDFYSKHSSQSPYFSQIPEEFLEYLEKERDASNDLPFMLELAHYEWVEMALAVQKTEDRGQRTEEDINLPGKTIQLSPLAWVLAYQYPVHKISPDFLPMVCPEQATFLIVYRDSKDDVNFIEITPVTYRLLEIIQENDVMGVDESLSQLAREFNQLEPEIIMSGGLKILEELLEKTVITLVT